MSKNYDELLAKKIWAVVGISENEDNFGLKIYKKLKKYSYNAYAVNPKLKKVYADTCYASLADLPVVPDVVNIVIRPELGLRVVEEAARLGVKCVWIQPGANAPNVIERGKELGLVVVGDACALVELASKYKEERG